MSEHSNSLQNNFFNWLGGRTSAAQLSELFFAYPEIEKFAQQIGILKEPLFKTKNLLAISLVKKMVETHPTFHSLYKKKLRKMSEAINFYYTYLCEQATQNKVKQVDIDSISKPVYENSDNVTYFHTDSQPISLSYFEDLQPIDNGWPQLYEKLMQCLYEDYPDTIEKMGKSADTNAFFSSDASHLSRPIALSDKLYLEMNITTSQIGKVLQKTLDECLVDYENIVVQYRNN